MMYVLSLLGRKNILKKRQLDQSSNLDCNPCMFVCFSISFACLCVEECWCHIIVWHIKIVLKLVADLGNLALA